jgi:hypothetical protein
MNILPMAFSIGTFTLDVPPEDIFPSFNPLVSMIGHALNHNHVDHSPGPITTTEFPDKQPRMRKRTRHPASVAPETCSICLDTIDDTSRTIQMPCGHIFHRMCVFSVLTTTTYGSDSMMRCPMCRYKLDRHDLQWVDCFP